jgi:hypothetical protein
LSYHYTTFLREFIEGFDFVRMQRDATAVVDGVPAGAIARCSEPGRQYAFYLHHSVLRTSKYVVRPGLYRDSPVFDLPPGRYAAEWVDPESERVVSEESFRHHGGRITLVPCQGDFDDRHSERPLCLRSGQAAGARNLCYTTRRLLLREILRRADKLHPAAPQNDRRIIFSWLRY